MLIANCRYCGAVFKSRLIAGNWSGNVTLSSNKESCPACGNLADIADGVFSVSNGMFKIISATDLTRAMYAKFLGLTEDAKKGKINDSGFIEAAEAIDPRLGAVARIAVKNKKLAALLFLILWLKSCVAFDVKLDVNDLYSQVFSRPGVEYIVPDQDIEEFQLKNKAEHKYIAEPDMTPTDREEEIHRNLKRRPVLHLKNQIFTNSTSYITIAAALKET